MRERGTRLEETLDVLHHAWTHHTVEYDGSAARIAACTIEPKPHQRPHPPVLLAAFSPAGFDRIARRADGWLPVGMPAEMIAAIWAGIRDAAERSGRNPDDLQLVVRANVKVTRTPQGSSRPPFTGTIEQIAADVCASADAGVHELIVDVQADARTGEEVLDLTERIVDTAGVREGHHVPATAITA
jgi:alkanesulfonate monooxygenase SsuD/methylene tetrahydromethanopterin reductase-like flavin-dependent oxidoreductase (luciferase family)